MLKRMNLNDLWAIIISIEWIEIWHINSHFSLDRESRSDLLRCVPSRVLRRVILYKSPYPITMSPHTSTPCGSTLVWNNHPIISKSGFLILLGWHQGSFNFSHDLFGLGLTKSKEWNEQYIIKGVLLIIYGGIGCHLCIAPVHIWEKSWFVLYNANEMNQLL